MNFINPRKIAVLAAVLTVLPLGASVALGASPGRALTKAKCKGCHGEGSAAGTMTPLSKTQGQWRRFFDKEQHEKAAPGTWGQISPKELEGIRQYLIEHAADSPQPETCG